MKRTTMRNTCTRLAVLLLASFAVSASSAESVPNGDFEKQNHGALAGWEPGRAIHCLVPNTDAGTENLNLRFVWDSVSHGNGKGSLRIDGNPQLSTTVLLVDRIDNSLHKTSYKPLPDLAFLLTVPQGIRKHATLPQVKGKFFHRAIYHFRYADNVVPR